MATGAMLFMANALNIENSLSYLLRAIPRLEAIMITESIGYVNRKFTVTENNWHAGEDSNRPIITDNARSIGAAIRDDTSFNLCPVQQLDAPSIDRRPAFWRAAYAKYPRTTQQVCSDSHILRMRQPTSLLQSFQIEAIGRLTCVTCGHHEGDS